MDEIMKEYYSLENRSVESITDWVNERKEEIIVAFIAKYGYNPDEVELVQEPNRWFIRKRED